MIRFKNFIINWGILLLSLLVLVIEFAVTHTLFFKLNRNPVNLILVILFLFLLFYNNYKNNRLNVLKSFFSAHHGDVNSFLGLFNIIFVFIQLHILATEIHHIVVPDPTEIHKVHVTIIEKTGNILSYVSLLFIPFLIHALFIKNKNEIPKSDRKVMVMALSSPSSHAITELIDQNFSSHFVIGLKPIYLSLKDYYNVNKLILLYDENAKSKINEGIQTSSSASMTFEEVIQKFVNQVNREVTIDFIKVDSFAQLNSFIKPTKKILEDKLHNNAHEDIMFNITSGPSTASVALSIFSLKGNRGMCYVTEKDDVVEFEVSAIDLEDVFSSFLNKSH